MMKRYFFAAIVVLLAPVLGGATATGNEQSAKGPVQAVSSNVAGDLTQSTLVEIYNIALKDANGNNLSSGDWDMASGESITVYGEMNLGGATSADYEKILPNFPDTSTGLKITDNHDFHVVGNVGYFSFKVTVVADENGMYHFRVDGVSAAENVTVTPNGLTQTIEVSGETGSTSSSSSDSSSSSSSTTEPSTSTTDSSTSTTSTTDSSTSTTSTTDSSTSTTSTTDSSTDTTSTTESSTSTPIESSTTSESKQGIPSTGQTPPTNGKNLPQTGEEIFVNKVLISVGTILMGLTTGLFVYVNKQQEK